MKIKMLAVLTVVLMSIGAFAQTVTQPQTFTIPVPDGTTIKSSPAGVWSCVNSSTGATLPTNLTFDGTTFFAPKISTNGLTINGPAVPAGNYLTTFDSLGNETFTPFTQSPPTTGTTTGSGTTSTPTYITVSASIPALANMPQFQVTPTVNVIIPSVTLKSNVTVTPVGPFDPNFVVHWNIPYAGYVAIWIQYNWIGSNKNYLGNTFNVTVF